MPGFDGTGPWGMGPGTGWGLGPCGGGRWFRRFPFGRGRGWGFRWWWNYSPEDELEMLKQQRDFIEQRIKELEATITSEGSE